MTGNVQKRPVVYLESSFVSYLTGRWSTNDGVRANQAASRAWWALMKDRVAPWCRMSLSKTVEIIGQAGFVCPVITDPAQLLRQMEYTP